VSASLVHVCQASSRWQAARAAACSMRCAASVLTLLVCWRCRVCRVPAAACARPWWPAAGTRKVSLAAGCAKACVAE
jgi:hypothetical protein